MRSTLVAFSLFAIPALARGVSLAAHAVERADVAGHGRLRVTFDPRIVGWDAQFVNGARLPLGLPLTGDTVGAAAIPVVARLEQDVRVASGVPGFIANLGRSLLNVRQERRTTPITAELGLSDRLSVSVSVPIVRVATRAHLQISSKGANLGLNPLLQGVANSGTRYGSFFAQFDTSLARLDANIAGGGYGCPPSRQCAAQAFLDSARGVRTALYEVAHGAGQRGSPFMPLDSSDGGRGIVQVVSYLQTRDSAAFNVTGFRDSFLLAHDTLSADLVAGAIVDSAYGFGYRGLPYRNSFRLGLGDIEVGAKYRLATGAHYAAALVALLRLPTAQRDSDDDWLRQALGDHQMDVEGRLIQELFVGSRLWVNVAVRGGMQRPGTRVRRVAPFGAILVPFAATAQLAWDPGDYAGVDVAPLYRLNPRFAAGLTASYWIKQQDRYTFRSAQDSLDLAARLGAPTSAALLDEGTAERQLRFGVAVTYVGPAFEGGLSIEQTVSGGTAGVTPAAPVYRIAMRTTRKLF